METIVMKRAAIRRHAGRVAGVVVVVGSAVLGIATRPIGGRHFIRHRVARRRLRLSHGGAFDLHLATAPVLAAVPHAAGPFPSSRLFPMLDAGSRRALASFGADAFRCRT